MHPLLISHQQLRNSLSLTNKSSTCLSSSFQPLIYMLLSINKRPSLSLPLVKSMDDHPSKQATSELEVSSSEWEFIEMSQQEEDLIHRMYRLVGNRWDLIAGRIPGRKAEEIERFWIMKHGDAFADRRIEHKPKDS